MNPYDARPFLKLPIEIARRRDLTATDTLVFAAICELTRRAEDRPGQKNLLGVEASYEQIRELVGRHRNVIRRSEDRLIAKRLIDVIGAKRGGPNGLRTYRLLRPQGAHQNGAHPRKVGTKMVRSAHQNGAHNNMRSESTDSLSMTSSGTAVPRAWPGVDEERELVRNFYRRLGQDNPSNIKIADGQRQLRKLGQQYTFEQVRYAVIWTATRVPKARNFRIVHDTISQALPEMARAAERRRAAALAERFQEGDQVRLGRKVGRIESPFVRFEDGVRPLVELAGQLVLIAKDTKGEDVEGG